MKLPVNHDICRNIIGVFNKRDENDYDFDSHEFISILRLRYSYEYYTALLDFMSVFSEEEAFQQMHSEIGKYLSKHNEILGIRPIGKHESPNYKGVNSKNEKWQKL